MNNTSLVWRAGRCGIFLGVALAVAPGCGGSTQQTAVVATPPNPPEGLEAWEHRHPEAARELGEWVRTHADAAARFFEWDSNHPDAAHEFVTWTIMHPNVNIDAFVATHRGWPQFDTIAENHRPAADQFMAWCRARPLAAEALMSHPGGLDWAGHHLYASYWSMATAHH